jgi:Holliday junction resolvase
MRRAAKIDANHGDVVKALRDAGCSVVSLASLGCGIPDLCIATPSGETWLFEVKNKAGKNKGQLNKEQKAFMAAWQGKYAVVQSAQQALEVIEIKTGEA